MWLLARDCIEVLVFFACPRNLTSLDQMCEYRWLLNKFPASLMDMRPACRWPVDVESALKQTAPLILQFSGHGGQDAMEAGVPSKPTLIFEDEITRSDVQVDHTELGRLLKDHIHAGRLKGLYLNACYTHKLAEALKKEFPTLSIIAWKGVITDQVAVRFSYDLFTALKASAADDAAFDVDLWDAYNAAIDGGSGPYCKWFARCIQTSDQYEKVCEICEWEKGKVYYPTFL